MGKDQSQESEVGRQTKDSGNYRMLTVNCRLSTVNSCESAKKRENFGNEA
jgi:hypothetical protein